MTKLLIATGIYPPDIGGPATYSFHLTEEFRKREMQVKIITYGEKYQNEKKQEVYFISRHQNLLGRYWQYFCTVFDLAHEVDLIYCLDLVSAGLPTILAAKLRKKKVIFRFGGDFLWEKAFQNGWTKKSLGDYYSSEKKWKEKLLFYFCYCLLRGGNYFVFSSNLQADIYKKYYRLPDARTTVINNPIQKTLISDYDIEVHRVITFAGRLIKLKNVNALIEAFSQINDNGLKLQIFGEGPQAEDLKKIVKNKRMEGRIIINRSISRQELIKVLQASMFFVLPSFTEISPNIALDCVSIGKPVLVTKENGLDQSITSHLVMIDPYSVDDIKAKMEFLLNEHNLANYKRELKMINIEERDWPDIASQYLKIFKNFIG